MKFELDGAKKISMHSDPADRNDDRITELDKGTIVKVLSESPYYGYNDRPYFFVRLNTVEEGYVLKEILDKSKKLKG